MRTIILETKKETYMKKSSKSNKTKNCSAKSKPCCKDSKTKDCN